MIKDDAPVLKPTPRPPSWRQRKKHRKHTRPATANPTITNATTSARALLYGLTSTGTR
jgi:hypothetical protein